MPSNVSHISTSTQLPIDKTSSYTGWAVHDASGEFRQITFHPRQLGDEDVEIEISHCGVCGSDVHFAFNEFGFTQYPCLPGHEIVGKVVRRGAQVTTHKVGDRVGVGAQAFACMNRRADHSTCEACAAGQENYCAGDMVWTFSSKLADGEQTRGGFASHIRVHGRFVFTVPDALPSNQAAPLLCGGATVWAPLVHNKVTKGTRVGVIGIGGLGHLAVQFASKMGATVTAIGASPDKEALARELGATHFVNTKDAAQVQAAARSLDLIVCTASGAGLEWDKFLSMVAWNGKLVYVGLSVVPTSFSPWSAIRSIGISGSNIASPQEIQDMLEFAAKHNVRAMIEEYRMSEINTAVTKVHENKVRFRAVLKNE